MRTILLVLVLVLISSASFGAVSEDVYIRQDVFSARMDAFMSEIRLMNEQLRSEIKQDIQNVRSELKQDIQDINARIDATNSRLDVTNARLDDLYTMVYWGLALMGIILAFIAFAPSFMNMLQNIRKPSITMTEIEALIEQKLMEKMQK